MTQVTFPDTTINGYRVVGYFPQWKSGRGHTAKRLLDTGVAAQLTHVNYAFANIHPDTLTCFISDHPGGPLDSPTVGDHQGYAHADFRRLFTADESVSGEADDPGQALAGNFNQLRQLKAAYPHLKVLISLGGWTWSKHFSRAAATPEGRARLVTSCVDLYLRGNLPTDGTPQGGEGAAAGVFDGVDIDWEWPGAAEWAQHPGNGVDPVHDRANATALLAEFRRQLDALGEQAGRRYLLSAFLPADPRWIDSGWDVPAIFESLDYGNVQGYDYYGSWDGDRAGHHANLYPDPTAPRDKAPFSLAATVGAYLERGVDPARLTAGMAAYGHGWTGVEAGATAGVWQPAAAGIRATDDGNTHYAAVVGQGRLHHDPAVGASWVFDEETGVFWSIDDPRSVALKAEFIAAAGLGGGMWWDLAGDDGDALTAALAGALADSRPGPVPSPVPGARR